MKSKCFLLITILSVFALIRFSFAGTPVFQDGGKQIQTFQLDVGWNSTPAQVDWDGDKLRDLVVGDKEGYVWFYRNSGTEFNPIFTTGVQIKDSTSQQPIDVGEFATPFVIDFDNNSQYDLIVGNKYGKITRFPMSVNPPYVNSPVPMSFTNNTLQGVFFINSDTGWIVGDNGGIFRTVDGGLTWMPQQSNTNENINGVHFLSSNEGWAVGNNNTILHYYIPSGQNEPIWESKTYGTPTNLHSVFFVASNNDSNNGWAVGDKGTILHYANGSWTTQASGVSADLHSVFFVDSSSGWIVGEKDGGNGTILQTINGGTTWTPVTINVTDLYSITQPPGTTTMWAVGANGTILRYYGTTWSAVNSTVTTNLYSVHFSDANTGWIAGADGTVLQYVNGTWVKVNLGVQANLYSVFINDATHGWAVGDDSTILFYNGVGWGTQSLNIDVGNNSAPFMFDLDEDGKKDLFVGDDPGNVWFFKNVGSDDDPDFRYGFRMNVGSQAQTGTSSNFIDVGQFATPQIADWNGDGTKDLLIGNGEGNVFLFKGGITTGTQTQGLIPLPGNRILTFAPGIKIQADKLDIDVGQRSAPLVMDWNKDGGLDLLVGVECGIIHVFLNDTPYQPPQFTLSSHVQGSSHAPLQIGLYSTPAMVDFDDDHRKDLLVGDENGFVTLFLNSGTDKDPIFTGGFELKVYGISAEKGTFTENLNVSGFARPFPVDWNNDGKKDLIVGNSLGQVLYFRNIQSDHAPLFAPGLIIQVGSPTKNLDVGENATPCVIDWNNDGKKDLVIGQGDGNVYCALNIGTDENPAFGTLTKLSTPDSEIDVGGYAVPFVIDYNGDHNKDLVVGDSDGYLTVFINIGTDKAPILDKGKSLRIEGQGNIDAGENAAPWVVDYDNSNSLDLVVGNKAGLVTLYRSSGIVDLYLTKSVDKTCASPQDILTYTIEYGNRGNFNADNVEITDDVPELTEFMGPAEGLNPILYFTNGTWTNQYSTATTKIKWVRNQLLQGAVEQKVSFTVKVVGTGPIPNFADIKSDQTYLQMSNIVTVIGTEEGIPDFSTAEKSVYPEGEVLPGTVLSFKIEYQNTGNGTATNVIITDIIDANLCNVTPENGGVYNPGSRTISWNIGTLFVRHGGEVRFNATVFAPLPAGVVIENIATITAIEGNWQTNKVQLTIPQTDSESDDWPMFHFNLSHEGYDSHEVIRPPLQLKWTGTLTANLRSSPVLADGKLYIGSGEKVYVFDAQAGNLVGSYATGAYIDSTPAIVKDRVYAANSTGWVYCWSTNPELKWAKQLPTSIQLSSCAVADGILYIGGLDKRLYAISIVDGKVKWVYSTNGVIQSSPAIANERVYFGSGDGNLYCLTTAGEFQWKFGTVGAIYSSPAVKDGVVYVGSNDGYIYAIELLTRARKYGSTRPMVKFVPHLPSPMG
ncbi:MAG: PQQ-binding-like beta-propeller repeat protein [Nitrospirota bacterium]